MISVSDQTGQNQNTSQKIDINFKSSWLRLKIDLKRDYLQKSWSKTDKKTRSANNINYYFNYSFLSCLLISQAIPYISQMNAKV